VVGISELRDGLEMLKLNYAYGERVRGSGKRTIYGHDFRLFILVLCEEDFYNLCRIKALFIERHFFRGINTFRSLVLLSCCMLDNATTCSRRK
jgi:hypothetical protein